ncbi:MAG: PEPxxWA-CTERM sorting domain-containing protein [Xanthobacteraceae bacterium]|nr:PEPxxWA-CTERM sorting domain-containing protein [Xanthobacteraceae bacterium]
MSLSKLATMFAAVALAGAAASGGAQAATVNYDLTFESGGSSVGSALLTLDLPSTASSLTVNAATAADFVRLTGTLAGDAFNVTPSSFANLFGSSGITLVDGVVTSIVTPFGGGGIGASGPTSSGFFFFNQNGRNANQPGLDFTFTPFGDTTINGTVTVAAVPEPATWVMLILGFAGLGYLIRRRTRTAAPLALA